MIGLINKLSAVAALVAGLALGGSVVFGAMSVFDAWFDDPRVREDAKASALAEVNRQSNEKLQAMRDANRELERNFSRQVTALTGQLEQEKERANALIEEFGQSPDADRDAFDGRFVR